jgi:hypothetical protein
MKRRWLFADQLGPHFVDEPDQAVLLVESKAVFRRRVFHRRRPARRPSRDCGISSSTGCPPSARTRTRCRPATR